MKSILITTIILLQAMAMQAQTTKISIAVLPFTAADVQDMPRAVQIQGAVIEILKAKSNLDFVDRSNDSLLLKELDNQTREQSMDAKGLVQQGKLQGASQMIAGTVANVMVEQKSTPNTSFLTGSNTTVSSYKASVNFSLQLIDVESGKVLSQKSFNNSQGSGKLSRFINLSTASTKEQAIADAIDKVKKDVLAWINASYPPDVRLLSVEKRNSKGLAETLLASGIDASLHKGMKLDVNEIQSINTGTSIIKRKVKIGALKIKELQGDVTVCEVIDGAELLEKKMIEKATIEIAAR